MNDIHIGFIEGTANYMNTNTAKEFPLNIAIHCSKGTQFTIQSQIANGRPRPSVDNISGDTSDPLQYVFPMFRNDDPRDYEFIGYRLNIVNPSDRLGSTSKYFGNGNPNDIGYNTSYLGRTGTDAIQEFNLLFQYLVLKILRDGDYSANHTFTVTY